MNQRIYIVDFMAQNPTVFWTVIHIAWGATYGAIITATAALYVVVKRYAKDYPEEKSKIVFAQIVWTLFQLAAVFSIPLLIGTIDRQILGAGCYVIYMLLSWISTMVAAWFLCRKHFTLSDLK